MLNDTENGKVSMVDEITSEFTLSHEVFGEGFYMADVAVGWLSGQVDIIPLMVSESLIDMHRDYTDHAMECTDQLHSHNQREGVRNRLKLSVFVRGVHLTQPVPIDCTKNNQIFLDGYICKSPVCRKASLEKEVADILLAVNRPYGKPDYVPYICWGRNARHTSELKAGARIKARDRVQSRGYIKRLSRTETELHTAYKVPILKLKRRGESERVY